MQNLVRRKFLSEGGGWESSRIAISDNHKGEAMAPRRHGGQPVPAYHGPTVLFAGNAPNELPSVGKRKTTILPPAHATRQLSNTCTVIGPCPPGSGKRCIQCPVFGSRIR